MLKRVVLYCPHRSTSIWTLKQTLHDLDVPVRRIMRTGPMTKETLVVNWGRSWDGNGAGTVLNKVVMHNKLKELQTLAAAGLPSPRHWEDPQAVCRAENLPKSILGRTFNHQQARDLRHVPYKPDFYVEKLNVIQEFRVHVFAGKCIRTGMKIPRKNVEHHPWIRSFDSGWDIHYGKDVRNSITSEIRALGKKAVKALGYDFGAVDIGKLAEGGHVVFEVNSAPSLQYEPTARVYARTLRNYLTLEA